MADAAPVTKTKPVKWNEKDYKSALAHLERLNNQLTSLRSTIPSIVQPLVRRKTNKYTTLAEISKAAVDAKTNMKEFREAWLGDRTQEILDRAKESEARDADLGPAREVKGLGWVEDGS